MRASISALRSFRRAAEPKLIPVLSAVGTLESDKRSSSHSRIAPTSRSALPYMQADSRSRRCPILGRVRCRGPYSNKRSSAPAGLGCGAWGLPPRAHPWLELRDRIISGMPLRSPTLPSPNASQARGQRSGGAVLRKRARILRRRRMDGWTWAISPFAMENARHPSSTRSRASTTAGSGSSRACPRRRSPRYLYAVLAGHDFQEGLKN